MTRQIIATQIQPWLFQGMQPPGVEAYETLKQSGVTHVLSVNAENPYVREAEAIFGTDCVLHIAWVDDGAPKPVEDFRRIYEWSAGASDQGGAVFLAHCSAGINRSTVASVWLITSLARVTPVDAFNEIVKRHPPANGFRVPAYRDSIARAVRTILTPLDKPSRG